MTPVQAARRQAALEPARADVQQALGYALAGSVNLGAALPPLRRATWLAHGSVDALINFGIVLIELGHHEAAATVFRRILTLAPTDPDGHHGAGVADSGLGRHGDGERRFRRALMLRPGHAETVVRLANVLIRLGRHGEALSTARRAIALAPSRVPALIDLGVLHIDLQRNEMSIRWAARALACEPTSVLARVNAAASLALLGRSVEAASLLRQAADQPQGGVEPYRNMLAVMSYVLVDETARWDLSRDLVRRFAPSRRNPRLENTRDPERPLVVGYLSSDFYEHPVARNLAPVIEAHDRAGLKTILYADVAQGDAMTARLRAAAGGWRRTFGLSDAEVAERIRADAVDILVIVASRFDKNRPLVACHRAAPIQMSVFDVGTSAVEEMDYLLADRTLVAPPRRRLERYSERVLRLPSLYVHAPLQDAPPPGPLPLLAAGHVTFACFNSPVKLSDRVLELWAEVMRAIPDARLHLKYQKRYGDPDLRRRLLARLAVDPGRIDFLPGGEPVTAHLRSYQNVDLALDSFPFTGSTTTWEALWMGVPVVSLLGDALAGRLSATFLRTAGLGELVATTPEAFVRIAVSLAQDPARLAALRSTLRDRVASSPLSDGAGRARQFERVFRATWRRWCGAPVFG